MRSPSRQKGFSLMFFMVLFALLGAGGVAGWMIGKPYMDAATVEHLAEEALKQAKLEPTMTEVEIRQSLFNNINVQGFPIEFSDIILRPIGEAEYEFEIDMTREIPLWDRASLVLNLIVTAQTP